MEEFIFGKLPPAEKRMQAVSARRAGVMHRQARAPFHPAPGQPVTLELTVGPQQHCDRAWVYWTTESADPSGQNGQAGLGHVTPMELSGTEWDTPLWGYLRRFQAVLPGQPEGTVVRYRIGAAGPDQPEILADDGAVYSYCVDDGQPPAWAQDAVVYQIFVDRFNPGEGYDWLNPGSLREVWGGRLKGITEKLGYLSELGVNTLWLSPIFPSPTHHGYDASDYLDIEPRLGCKADLRELIDEAQRRGIRVLLDLVPNHVSNLHASFQAAVSDPASPYHDWYTFTDWPEKYLTFFGARTLPKLNLRYAPARQYLLDAAVYWLEFGVDGFRIDHAIGPAPDFWADFRRATRTAKPDCWTFGEVTDPPDLQLTFAGGLDGCLDFLLAEALRAAVGLGRWSAARLADFLDRHNAFFPASFSRPSFIDNHDMNRFLWVSGGDARRLRLAALCQFTLPGQPVIYHGTEVGLSQERDVHDPKGEGLDEARLPHPWDARQDRDLFAYFQALIAMRRQNPVFHSGKFQVLHADENTLAYRVSTSPDDPQSDRLVALNLSEKTCSLSVDGNWGQPILVTSPGCSTKSRSNEIQIQLPPLGGMILEG